MKFKIIFLLVVITRILDGLTTYWATPSLKYELNPIIQYLNLGWFGFFILGLIFTVFVLWISYYSFKKIELYNIKAHSFKSYLSLYFYNEPNSFGKLLYAFPLKQRFFVFVGQVFPISLIYFSVFLVINNTFIALCYKYDFLNTFFIKIHTYHSLIISIVPIIIFLLVSYFFMYKKYDTYNLKG